MMTHAPLRLDVGTVLRLAAERNPDKNLLIFTDTLEKLSYGAFDVLVNRAANALAQLNVKHGDYVNLMLPNCKAYLVLSYAIKRLGAIEVAVNCEFRGAALARVLNLAPSAVLVTTGEFAPHLQAIAADVTVPRAVIATSEPAALEALWRRQCPALSYDDFLAAGDAHHRGWKVRDLDIGVVIFTSGTTGPSKGCLVTHRSIVRGGECIRDALQLTASDVVYTAYPLFHTRAAVLDVFAALLAGGTAVLAPRFSASRFWADMARFDVTMFSIIGTVMQILWKQPPADTDRKHRVRISWGGPITVNPVEFRERFGVQVLPGEGVYGMSETGMVSITSVDPALSGRVQPGYEVRIGDNDDDAVPTGDVGEILVRPSEPGVVFSGYMAMPAETVKAWRNLWFHTGDLGRIDADGRLIFVGRKRDTIRCAGHNISSWEVEEVIERHPSVLECAVIGIPNELGEELVKAYVVPKPDHRPNPLEIVEFCRGRMASFMVPSEVSLIGEIPKTQTGKPAKSQLLALYRSQQPKSAITIP